MSKTIGPINQEQPPALDDSFASPPIENGLRHYPRSNIPAHTEIVDRYFNFVRVTMHYDYRYTSNSQIHREAQLICEALEGPMEAGGVWRVIDGKAVEEIVAVGGAKQPSTLGADDAHDLNQETQGTDQ